MALEVSSHEMPRELRIDSAAVRPSLLVRVTPDGGARSYDYDGEFPQHVGETERLEIKEWGLSIEMTTTSDVSSDSAHRSRCRSLQRKASFKASLSAGGKRLKKRASIHIVTGDVDDAELPSIRGTGVGVSFLANRRRQKDFLVGDHAAFFAGELELLRAGRATPHFRGKPTSISANLGIADGVKWGATFFSTFDRSATKASIYAALACALALWLLASARAFAGEGGALDPDGGLLLVHFLRASQHVFGVFLFIPVFFVTIFSSASS